MADIRSYLKEKEKREENQEDFKNKIRRHRLGAVYRVLMVLVAVGVLVTLVVIQYRNHIYTGYETVFSAPREPVSGSVDVRLGNSILTYSKDGAHCTDQKGNILWNETFEIQDVVLSVCGDVAAIGDYNGRNIYIVNSAKKMGEITTTMPIRSIAVSSNGRVAVVTADTDLTWINLYDLDGKPLYEGRTSMQNSGYPAAVSLSPNGELMMVSFIYLDAGIQKTNIAFYNFGPVGDNQNDNLMSIWTYSDQFVPKVQFLDNETAFAVGDSRLMIYTGSQKPVVKAEYLYNSEVKSVVHGDRYVGIVFYSDNAQARYKMDVYNTAAELVGSYYFDLEYSDIFFGKDSFTVYNDAECLIMTLGGTEKYRGGFAKSVNRMIPVSSSYKYVIAASDSIDIIQLK